MAKRVHWLQTENDIRRTWFLSMSHTMDTQGLLELSHVAPLVQAF